MLQCYSVSLWTDSKVIYYLARVDGLNKFYVWFLSIKIFIWKLFLERQSECHLCIIVVRKVQKNSVKIHDRNVAILVSPLCSPVH